MTTAFDDLRPAAANMLKVNMSVKAGERVLFVSDVSAPEDWQRPFPLLEAVAQGALMTKRISEMMAEEYPECTVAFMGFPATYQHGAEPPAMVAEAILEYDVVFLMTHHSLSHTAARQAGTDNGVRIASMPGVEAYMFNADGPMNADYEADNVDCVAWAEKLTQGKQVHITTPSGTDLKFTIEGREGNIDNGLYSNTGDWGNLPAGEAYVSPIEGSAEGKLVVPAGWYPGLKEEMTMTFEGGYVTAIEGGGEVGAQFIQTFDFGNDMVKHRRNCAELGVGTNSLARRPDNVLEAEKIKGTIHIGVGDSSHMGGVTESDSHEDFVQVDPTLLIDGQTLIG
jgi:aminopeptidase